MKDQKFYIGYTINLKQRYDEHCRGLVDSTKNRLPMKLIGYEAYLNEKDARKRELYLKGGGKAQQDLKLRFEETL